MKVVVFGASGLSGGELLRLIDGHPDLELVGASAESLSGTKISEVYPMARAKTGSVVLQNSQTLIDRLQRGNYGVVDAAFMALPHGVSSQVVSQVHGSVGLVVDLSADFRLRDPKDYLSWYGEIHRDEGIAGSAVYGLPELCRKGLVGASLVAVAGCYVTAATLAILPFVQSESVVRSGIIVDAASGVSGAGKSLRLSSMYGQVAENFSVYGLKHHRHTIEMQRNTDTELLFTPHLAPMSRGILATCYLRPTPSFEETLKGVGAKEADGLLAAILGERYGAEPFVRLPGRAPDTKSVMGSNDVAIYSTYDPRTGWIIVISALDNLTKGASGQALQCANIALGLSETAGLVSGGFWA